MNVQPMAYILCLHCGTRNFADNRGCYSCAKTLRPLTELNDYENEPLFQAQSKNGKPIVYWGEGDPYLNDSFRAWRKVTDWLLQEENLLIFATIGWITIVTLCLLLVLSL